MATGSPTWRTMPLARPGCARQNIGLPSGRLRLSDGAVVPMPSRSRSSMVNTPITPGAASAAAASTAAMRARACGERT